MAVRGQLGARQRGLPLRTLLCSSGETDSKQVNKPAKQDGFSISVMKNMKQGAALGEEATFFFFFFFCSAARVVMEAATVALFDRDYWLPLLNTT